MIAATLATTAFLASTGTPGPNAQRLIEQGRDLGFVKRTLSGRSPSATDIATAAWCQVWQQRLNLVKLGPKLRLQYVSELAALWDRAQGPRTSHFFHARHAWESQFWSWLVVPGSPDYPMRRVPQAVTSPDGRSRIVYPIYQSVDKPTAKVQSRIDESWRKAVALGPNDPEILLAWAGRARTDDPKAARNLLSRARQAGVESLLPVQTLVMMYDLDSTASNRANLVEYLRETGDSRITKCLLKGRTDLAAMVKR